LEIRAWLTPRISASSAWVTPAALRISVSWNQDRKCVPRVIATLRSLAISPLHVDGHDNIAAANRYHARDPHRTPHTASNRMNDFAGSLAL
jgi:hypothetical protein